MTLDLRPTLDRLGVSLRDLARGSAMSLGAAHNLAAAGELPRRSADAVQTFEAKAKALLAQADAHLGLSTSLAHEDA